MPRLDLSREEAETLAAVLEGELSDLSYEIANTDSFDFRSTLKQKQTTMRNVLESLKAARELV
jgi:hypothetical protein